MEKYVQYVNQNSQEGAFLRAVLATKNNQFKDAFSYIHKVLTLLKLKKINLQLFLNINLHNNFEILGTRYVCCRFNSNGS